VLSCARAGLAPTTAPFMQIEHAPGVSTSDVPVCFGGQRSHGSHVLQNAVNGDGASKRRAHLDAPCIGNGCGTAHQDAPCDFCTALKERGILCKNTHEHSIHIAPRPVITREQVDWTLDRFGSVPTEMG